MTPEECKEVGLMVIHAFETANYRWHWQIQRVPWCDKCMKKAEKLITQMIDNPGENMPSRA